MATVDQAGGNRARLMRKLGHLLEGSSNIVTPSKLQVDQSATSTARRHVDETADCVDNSVSTPPAVISIPEMVIAADQYSQTDENHARFLRKLGHLLYANPSSKMMISLGSQQDCRVPAAGENVDAANVSTQSPIILLETSPDFDEMAPNIPKSPPPPFLIKNEPSNNRLELLRKLDKLLNRDFSDAVTTPKCKQSKKEHVSKNTTLGDSAQKCYTRSRSRVASSSTSATFFALATNRFECIENRHNQASPTFDTSPEAKNRNTLVVLPASSVDDDEFEISKPKIKSENRKFSSQSGTTRDNDNQLHALSAQVQIGNNERIKNVGDANDCEEGVSDHGAGSIPEAIVYVIPDDNVTEHSDWSPDSSKLLSEQTRSATLDHMYTPECRYQLLNAELFNGDAVQRAQTLNLHLTELLEQQRLELAKSDARIIDLQQQRREQDTAFLATKDELNYFKSCYVAAVKYNGNVGGGDNWQTVEAAETSIPEELLKCQKKIEEFESQRSKHGDVLAELNAQLNESRNSLTDAEKQLAKQQSDKIATEQLLNIYRDRNKKLKSRLRKKCRAVDKLNRKVKVAVEESSARNRLKPSVAFQTFDERANECVAVSTDQTESDNNSETSSNFYYVLVNSESMQVDANTEELTDGNNVVQVWCQEDQL